LDTEYVDPKYKDYSNYYSLSDHDTRTLVAYCEALSPSFLEDKCFFRNDAYCAGKDTGNRFLDISSKEVTFAAAESVMVLGRKAFVTKVMVYSGSWKRKNYDNPLSEVKRSFAPSPVYTARRRSSGCIII
jgi:hypothetical protein